ncbi:MAG: hypothetical protein LUH07_01790 [Lachnospiraceae bacterium]|nr:hypothetical protein [Lachnospiraceae bacterium]
MSKIAIPVRSILCEDGTADNYVGLNTNTDADDKVQAFVDRFKLYAQTSSSLCYNLPVKLILGIWGGESGWASASRQQNNQNWANMSFLSFSNPVGCIAVDDGGWAVFEGAIHHANAFGYWFINNSKYASLITYLKGTSTPDIYTCLNYIANAGYGGSDADSYITAVKKYISALEAHSDIS